MIFLKIIVLIVCLIQLGLICLKVYTSILVDIEIDIPEFSAISFMVIIVVQVTGELLDQELFPLLKWSIL